jgi:hypothetical protein
LTHDHDWVRPDIRSTHSQRAMPSLRASSIGGVKSGGGLGGSPSGLGPGLSCKDSHTGMCLHVPRPSQSQSQTHVGGAVGNAVASAGAGGGELLGDVGSAIAKLEKPIIAISMHLTTMRCAMGFPLLVAVRKT